MSQNVSAEQQVYLAEDIQRLLALGRSKTYDYLNKVYQEEQPFKVIKIGKLLRVPKHSFDSWLYGQEDKD